LRKVHIALDLGTSLQIDKGLTTTDRIIENPPDSLMDGDKVRVDETPDDSAAGRQVAAEDPSHDTR
jgi:membrane fusion protein, multidrug efflux system